MKRILIIVVCLVGVVSCGSEVVDSSVRLRGLAVLDADTFVPGPSVGVALGPEINGRKLPFKSLPVQGFSSLVPLGESQYLALQDNGFGTKKNSPDYPLGWFQIKIEFSDEPGGEGSVTILQTTHLSDPDGFFPYPLEQPADGRFFTGSDLDPESFVRLADGTLWVGDEFGPWMLHFSAAGKLLEPPVGVPTPEAMLSITGFETELRSEDHPLVLAGDGQKFSIPRSGGLEGMTLSHDGSLIYVSIEKKLMGDSFPNRRLILEFSLSLNAFTNKIKYYQADGSNISLAAMETWGTSELLVTERDGGEGEGAKIKRVYSVKLESANDNGYLEKELVCDLMKILDEDGYTKVEEGAVGLGKQFSFPFVTPEVLVAIDEKTILVANDNNYPMSSGRRPGGTPDNTEFILLELPLR